jgi:cell division protein FtsN
MNRNSGNRSSTGKGGSMLAGILLGMVLGLLIASGVAWYIMKRPNPYVNHDQRPELSGTQPAPAGEPQSAPSGPATAANAAAAAGDSGKPHFEFYKVLTDNQPDGSLPAQQPAAKPAAPANAPAQADASQNFFLQAGSFSNEADADKLKARLALLGMEASVQSVTIPDKGVWHRVRLGPYRSSDEMNKARSTLKQNGVDATPMRN